MAGGRFSKQAAPYLNFKYLNPNVSPGSLGDPTEQGAITTAPSGVTGINQGLQNLPGDRIILDPMSAYSLQNNNTGNLFTGTYRYVNTRNNSTSVPQRARACFWDLAAVANNNSTYLSDAQYQVNSDEPANIGVVLMAGVFITSPTAGNLWWIQESGKAYCQFRGNNFGGNNLTGTPAIGCGVYLAAASNANNNTTVGLFDVLVGANSAAIFTANSTTGYSTIDQMMTRYVGPAELLPSNNNISLVDLEFKRGAFRW